ncbi:hypothetical protein LSTR_LSTR004385 [Laodelphax striatellus]|uniref:RRM domain-containing protein n=1 Tax=Laodelphax striatellus TaxID=195883 RepID=A0A482X941_LAOST|nr:hypothetical protein LSTR_LSTR004385 [Laodelphax striatellus]
MAEPGEELLDGELGDGDYNELDADEEEALLADDNGYTRYNLPSVSSHRDVYISTSPEAKSSRKIKVEDVEDVAEGDEILDNEDVLELGVDGNWNIDDLDSESQEQNRNSEGKPSLFQLWIKQERIDPSEFSRRNEPEEDEDKHEPGKKSAFITSSADISQSHLHDDDDEDDHERRDRFTSERSMPGVVSLKSPDSKWGTIPDSLDSVITPNVAKVTVQKSSRASRGGGGTPVRRGGGLAGRIGTRPPTHDAHAPHHKVLINPHFKGTTPAPPSHQFPQTHPGSDYRAAQQAHQQFDQPGHQYQKQQEYQQYQTPINNQYPPHPHSQYQDPSYPHSTPHGVPGQGPHYQNEWQNPAGPVHQQYEQSNYPGYYGEVSAPPHPAWNSPGQPVYQDYNQRPVAPHPHTPHQQSPHQPPHHQPPPQPHPAMRPPIPQSIQHIVSQQQPPPPGLEAEFQPRKPSPFPHQGGPPRPFFPPQHHQPPFRPQGGPFPPPLHNHSPRFPPRFKRGGFQRGGIPPQFRHPGGPRMMPPGPLPPSAMFHPRPANYHHQQQPIKRPHPEPPHQLPFKQMRLNPNCPDPSKPGQRERNLLEVQTVDNVPDTTTCSDQATEEEFDEDDDEETREYKRKIAEQKRLREKLLQEKEERRKLAAVAKQKELEQRKVASQNVPNTQSVSIAQNAAAYSESSQPTVDANDGNRVSVHQRIGVKTSPGKQFDRGSTQVTFFNEQQPAAFKMVRVRTKDGTVLIKKLPINSAGQRILQRPAPPLMVHHQPQQMMPQMNPVPPQHLQPPQQPALIPPQHQHIYSQQAAPHPLPPHPAPPQPEQHNQYYQPQPNAPPYHMQPQPVQQPFYQQPPHQMMPTHNPVPVVNSKRIVLDRPQQANFKATRSKVKPVFKKPNVNSNSSVLTIVPVNKNMTLGQRFAMQNKQVKKEQTQPQQQQKVPVQAQPVTKPNRTVINSVLNAGAPTIRIPLPPGPVTSKVVVDNLTAGTSRQQLVSMAEQVGEVKILTLDTSQKRASITFNNTKAATAFYQKFQRKMVNLSMINVTFVSE